MPTESGTEPERSAGTERADAEILTAELVVPETGPQMLHPMSLLFQAVSHGRRFLIPAIAAIFFAARGGPGLAIPLAIVFLVGLGTEVFRYLTLRYMIRAGELVVTQGLLFRSERHVPLGRIQNIDLVQNPLHRLFGVAEVRVETASGKEPEAVLRVLALPEVEKLRGRVFGRPAAGGEAARASAQAEAAERPVLLRLGTGDLVAAGLISNRGWLLIPVLVGVVVEFDLVERLRIDTFAGYLPQGLDAAAWAALVAAALAVGIFVMRLLSTAWYVLRFSGYRLELDEDDLRIECGLVTRISATVPRRRIQFISVQRTLLGRRFGRSAIRIETAGGAGAGEGQDDAQASMSRRWFVPTIRDRDVPRLLEALRPGVEFGEEEFRWRGLAPRAGRRLMRVAAIRAAVVAGVGWAIWQPWGWTAGAVALPLLMYVAWLDARKRRYARTDWGVAYRSGVLVRKSSYTFFDKIQVVRKAQTIFDRRWRMATLNIDTPAAGPADHRIRVRLLDEDFVEQEARVVARAAGARKMQWA